MSLESTLLQVKYANDLRKSDKEKYDQMIAFVYLIKNHPMTTIKDYLETTNLIDERQMAYCIHSLNKEFKKNEREDYRAILMFLKFYSLTNY